MIVFFSGTGNSRFASEMFADSLHDELIDAGKMIRAGEKASLTSLTPWIFVSPTYAWQIPHIFADFIRGGSFEGNRKAYFVMTCGSENGNAGEKLEELCREKGFEYEGVSSVIMPENYIAMFPVTAKEQAEKIVAQAKPELRKLIDIVRAEEPFLKAKVSLGDRLKSGPVNPLFYRFFVHASPFFAKENCVGCGVCVQNCPLNNIHLDEKNRPQWGTSCTHCMACICLCPYEAIEYGKKSKGQPRYHCVPFKK